ncbi:DUF3892 domain-containing protein [Pseudomonas chlororaphis]|uniref:DUF3892 domain-containing protein n=1 Tax=Pseudomonas chlororaphis TaxID=587753 RepID=UPI001E450BD5|nr:DUF3892 domain-containing protein [Pseudomonas chlororaphis]MCB2255982.1 DUF3892 domain-containing protein [Pseudomonas chlororaphis]
MADFCITKVKYSEDGEHIQWVIVREEIPAQRKIGSERKVERAFVADLIRLGKASFQTRVWNSSDSTWDTGANIHLIDNEFLSTDRNSRKRDNLGNLPTFV